VDRVTRSAVGAVRHEAPARAEAERASHMNVVYWALRATPASRACSRKAYEVTQLWHTGTVPVKRPLAALTWMFSRPRWSAGQRNFGPVSANLSVRAGAQPALPSPPVTGLWAPPTPARLTRLAATDLRAGRTGARLTHQARH
jgi:hypothetical protein